MASLVWLLIFISRENLRREMLIMSFGISWLGISEALFWSRYWEPEFLIKLGSFNIGLESLLICFLYGGAFGTLYEFVFKKSPIRDTKYRNGKKVFLFAIGLGFITLLISNYILNTNLIYSSALALMTVTVIFYIFRKDLIKQSLVTGVMSLIISLIVYAILNEVFPTMGQEWYVATDISGIRIFSFPIEEILWHVPLAMCVSGMYEVIYNEGDR